MWYIWFGNFLELCFRFFCWVFDKCEFLLFFIFWCSFCVRFERVKNFCNVVVSRGFVLEMRCGRFFWYFFYWYWFFLCIWMCVNFWRFLVLCCVVLWYFFDFFLCCGWIWFWNMGIWLIVLFCGMGICVC